MPAREALASRKAGRPRVAVPRTHLVETARAVFADRGYHGTTLDRIAEQAGIRRASLLHHFGDKASLYQEVLDQVVVGLQDLIREASGARTDYPGALDALGSRIVDTLGRRPGVARLLLRELVDGGPYLEGAGGRAVQETLEFTAGFLAAGMTAGVFLRQDPRQLALTIVGLHLYYFATLDSTGSFLGAGAYSDAGIEVRKTAVLAHVRSLCLGTPAGVPDPSPALRRPRTKASSV